MYAAAKENNMSHKITPETAPQQKKRTAAEIKACLAKYRKAEAAKPEEEDAETETSDPFGGLFG